MTSTDFAVRASAHRNRTEPTGETEMRSAIKSTALVREYGEVTAVNGVDLDVAAGEIYGFLGPNGAGKSTTTRVLCTLLSIPSAGSATVAGFDVAHPAGGGAVAHRGRAPGRRPRSPADGDRAAPPAGPPLRPQPRAEVASVASPT